MHNNLRLFSKYFGSPEKGRLCITVHLTSSHWILLCYVGTYVVECCFCSLSSAVSPYSLVYVWFKCVSVYTLHGLKLLFCSRPTRLDGLRVKRLYLGQQSWPSGWPWHVPVVVSPGFAGMLFTGLSVWWYLAIHAAGLLVVVYQHHVCLPSACRWSVIGSCNNVAPVKKRVSRQSYNAVPFVTMEQKKSCSWNIKTHYLRFKHFIITITTGSRRSMNKM
jgi:hypothetical protein